LNLCLTDGDAAFVFVKMLKSRIRIDFNYIFTFYIFIHFIYFASGATRG